MLDPYTSDVYALIVQEISFDMTPGHWSAVCTMYRVDVEKGQWFHTNGNPLETGHVATDARALLAFQRWLTCETSTDGVRHVAEIDVGKFHVTLKCPYTHRPTRPEHAIDQSITQSATASSNYWSLKETDAHSIPQFNDFRMRSQIRFFHPFFVNARYSQSLNQPINPNVGTTRDFSQSREWDMSPVTERMVYLKQLAERFAKDDSSDFMVEYMLEQQSALQTNSQSDSQAVKQSKNMQHSLDAETCLACVPPVEVTLCSAPLINQALVNQMHASTGYHVGLGIQRQTVYDRWGWYEAVLSPYIKSGLIDYHPKPLPFDTLLDRVEVEQSGIYGTYFDQHISIETCRVLAAGVSAWISYKDTDEWLVFPHASGELRFDHTTNQTSEELVKGSFVRGDRVANCIHPEWRQSDELLNATRGEWRQSAELMNVTRGERNYVHISAGKQHRSQSTTPSSDRTLLPADFQSRLSSEDASLLTDPNSIYSYYQPEAALAFLNIHRQSNTPQRSSQCTSQLSAWLHAMENLNLYQARTPKPQLVGSSSHHSPDHRIPAALPNIVNAPEAPAVRIGKYLETGSIRMDWIGLCDVIMGGISSTTDHPSILAGAAASGHQLLMIEQWRHRKAYHPHLLDSSPHLKWFARPQVTTVTVHMAKNAPGDMRPCDEIRFNHYKNFPHQRVDSSIDPRDWMSDTQVLDFYYCIINAAGDPPQSA